MTALPPLVSSRRNSTVSRVTTSEASLRGEILRKWDSTNETFNDHTPRSTLSTPTSELRRTTQSVPVTADAYRRLVRSSGFTEASRQQNSRPVYTEDWKRVRGKQLSPLVYTAASVSNSWLWKDCNLTGLKKQRWKRDYRSFTHSAYLPPCRFPDKEIEEKRWKTKCGAWLEAHQLWMQQQHHLKL